ERRGPSPARDRGGRAGRGRRRGGRGRGCPLRAQRAHRRLRARGRQARRGEGRRRDRAGAGLPRRGRGHHLRPGRARRGRPARTDAFVRGGDKPVAEKVAGAIERGRAYLDAGADIIFVPGVLDADVTRELVAGIGERKISVIGLPGALTAAQYEALGVARISYGPTTQRSEERRVGEAGRARRGS